MQATARCLIKEKVALLSLVVIAAIMNGFLLIRNPNIGGDALQYLLPIHNLMAGKGYTYCGSPELWMPPGYGIVSYILFLFIRDIELSGMLASALSYLLIIPTTYYTVRFLFGKKYAFLSSFLVAFCPTLISYSYVNFSESTFFFFLLLSFFIYVRTVLSKSSLPQSILLGILLVFTSLIRPEGFLIAVLALPSLFVLSVVNIKQSKEFGFASMLRRLSYPAVTVLVFLTLALPYVLFNYEHTGNWTFSIKASHFLAAYGGRVIKVPWHNIKSEILQLLKINFHALVPLAFLWFIFPFFSTRKLFAKLKLDFRNIRIALSFIIFLSPLSIWLIFFPYARYLLPYSLFILFLLSFLMVRFFESLEIKGLSQGIILVCAVSLISLLSYVLPVPYPSLYKTLTTRHAHLALRAAGFFLQDHVQNLENLTIIDPRKGYVALFYASGKKEPRGKDITIPPNMTLEEVAILVTTGKADYLLLDNHYIHTRPQLIPLWNNPSLAQEYGLFPVYIDTDGLFQIYTSGKEH